jgi:hypothetical protein
MCGMASCLRGVNNPGLTLTSTGPSAAAWQAKNGWTVEGSGKGGDRPSVKETGKNNPGVLTNAKERFPVLQYHKMFIKPLPEFKIT